MALFEDSECEAGATNTSSGLRYVGVNDKHFEEYMNEADASVLVRIPAGEFLAGTSDEDVERLLREYPDCKRDWFELERPRREVSLPDYYVGKHEITNEQFSRFVSESGYGTQGNWRDYADPSRKKHPVVCVRWDDASAYCKWAGLRLPSDDEWEKAARGTEGRLYPWGDAWDKNLCNNLTTDRDDLVASRTSASRDCLTIRVGMIPGGASPFGALDMAGNVWEWCDGLFAVSRGTSSGEGCFEERFRVLRGGSWHGDRPIPFRCASRLLRPPGDRSPYAGFRCARGK